MPNIFVDNEIVKKATDSIKHSVETAVSTLTGTTPSASDPRFAHLQTTATQGTKDKLDHVLHRADHTNQSAAALTKSDAQGAHKTPVVNPRAVGSMSQPGSETIHQAIEKASRGDASQLNALTKSTQLQSTPSPPPTPNAQTTAGPDPARQSALRQYMAEMAARGTYQAPVVQAAPQPVPAPQTQYERGVMPEETLRPQLAQQSAGMGSHQPDDVIHLTPQQVRILADYLASQQPSAHPAPGGAAGGKPIGHIDFSRANGDYEHNVLALADEVVNANIPYAWGGGSLDGPSQGTSDNGGYADYCGDYAKQGFDCSGLARFITYQTTGIEIPRVSQDQYSFCTPVAEPEIGDLGFPPGGSPAHVVVYVGDGQVVEAQQSGTNVMFSEAPANYVWGRVPQG